MVLTVTKTEGLLDYDDIHFGFEEFLKEHEENLPQGLDPQYLAYVSIIEKPLRNLRKLPRALRTLPMNALLHQSWRVLYSLIGIILFMGSPALVLLIQTAQLNDRDRVGGVLVFMIILGYLVSPGYLKLLYTILSDLIETKKAPWLVETIEKPFNENYQTPWKLNYFYAATILTIIMDAMLITFNLFDGGSLRITGIKLIIWIFFLIWGHIGITLMLYISILSYRYVAKNSRIYDLLMIKITERVRGYTEGHESILSKKNYEVVGVLSDTPGLSIRSLGDIPILGLASSTAIVNAIIFLILGPLFLAFKFGDAPLGDPTGLTPILLFGLFFSLFAAFGAIIMPIFRVWYVIRRFRTKALKELDPFLFDEITGVALNRDTELANETQVLYMLRNYIYIMKSSPVNPLRLIQISLLLFIYITRVVPIMMKLLEVISR